MKMKIEDNNMIKDKIEDISKKVREDMHGGRFDDRKKHV